MASQKVFEEVGRIADLKRDSFLLLKKHYCFLYMLLGDGAISNIPAIRVVNAVEQMAEDDGLFAITRH